MSRTLMTVSLAAAAVTVPLFACMHPNDQQATAPTAQATYVQPQPTQPGQPAPTYQAPTSQPTQGQPTATATAQPCAFPIPIPGMPCPTIPGAGTGTGSPQPQPQPTGGGTSSGGTATAVGIGFQHTAALELYGRAEMSGMSKDGEAFAAQFQTGQTFEGPTFSLQSGKCYGAIATNVPPTVTSMTIKVVAVSPVPMVPGRTIAEGSGGSNASAGARGACGSWSNPTPFPVSGRVIITVTGGSGTVAAQSYSK